MSRSCCCCIFPSLILVFSLLRPRPCSPVDVVVAVVIRRPALAAAPPPPPPPPPPKLAHLARILGPDDDNEDIIQILVDQEVEEGGKSHSCMHGPARQADKLTGKKNKK